MALSKGVGGTQEPESEYACIVYDPETGRIQHIHWVVNLPGANVPSREQMKETALRHAAKGYSSKLAVLQVTTSEIDRHKSYLVDHVKQALVVVKERGLAPTNS